MSATGPIVRSRLWINSRGNVAVTNVVERKPFVPKDL
jgi:hypothetical protein